MNFNIFIENHYHKDGRFCDATNNFANFESFLERIQAALNPHYMRFLIRDFVGT